MQVKNKACIKVQAGHLDGLADRLGVSALVHGQRESMLLAAWAHLYSPSFAVALLA